MARQAAHPAIDPALTRFAQVLRERLGARRVLLFGSRARGQPRHDSDYDVIIVARQFVGVEPLRRAVGLRQWWYEAGGDSPMDLICLTPEEFELARGRIGLVAAVLPEAVELLPRAVAPTGGMS
ncbi:MAG: nucleotidyltransferase domain-containing protein [Chloroflexota bacterium]|nr:nucleotidyltransferase domain-containing protein [Chloroflexota bacterium]